MKRALMFLAIAALTGCTVTNPKTLGQVRAGKFEEVTIYTADNVYEANAPEFSDSTVMFIGRQTGRGPHVFEGLEERSHDEARTVLRLRDVIRLEVDEKDPRLATPFILCILIPSAIALIALPVLYASP